MRLITISRIKDILTELSDIYDISKQEIEILFYETLEEYYDTKDIIQKGEGIVIDGRYKNIRHNEYLKIVEIFKNKLVKQSQKKIREYLRNIIEKNNKILYCKLIGENEKNYLLQPLISKNKEIKYLKVVVNKYPAKYPKKISAIPVHIYSMPERKKKYYIARGAIIDAATIKKHNEILSKKIEKILGIKVELEFVGYSKNTHKVIILKSKKMLTKAIIKYIVTYYKSFDIVVKFAKR